MAIPNQVDLLVLVSVNPDGTLRVSDGQTLVTRTGLGTYEMTLAQQFPLSELIIFPVADAQPGNALPTPAVGVPSDGVLNINTFDAAGTLSDEGWSMTVYRVTAGG